MSRGGTQAHTQLFKLHITAGSRKNEQGDSYKGTSVLLIIVQKC